MVKQFLDRIIKTSGIKNMDEKTFEMYKNIVEVSKKISGANKSNYTESREKLLKIFRLLEEVLMGKKSDMPSLEQLESENLDIAQGEQTLKAHHH